MNFRTTAVLLILVLAGGAWWLMMGDRARDTGDAATDSSGELRYVLGDARPQTKDLVRVVVARSGEPDMVFERGDDLDPATNVPLWRMTSPVASATESYMVDGIAGTLIGLQYRARFAPDAPDAVTAQTAGLDNPVAVYTLADNEGKEYRIEVGRRAALSNDTYVRGVDGAIYLCQRDFSIDLRRKPSDYRAKGLFKLSRRDATQVRVLHAEMAYELARSGDDWVMSLPARAHANPEKVNAIVNAVANARVAEFIEDAPAAMDPYGLDKPFLTVYVTTRETRELPHDHDNDEDEEEPHGPPTEVVERTFAIAFGAFADMESKHRYVRLLDQPWVASVDKARADEVIAALAELRDTRLARIRADDVTEIEIRSGDDIARLRRGADGWSGEGELARLEADAVRDLLEALEDARAIDFIDHPGPDAEYGLDAPRSEVRVVQRGQVEPLTIQFGAETASARNRYVRLAGQASVAVLSAPQAARIAVTPMALRSRSVFTLDSTRISEVHVRRGERAYVLERDEAGAWTLTEPADTPVDEFRAAALVSDLARLRASGVAARGDFAQYGLDDPELTIEFAVQPEAAPSPAQTADAADEPSHEDAENADHSPEGDEEVETNEQTEADFAEPAGETMRQQADSGSAEPVRHVLAVGRVDERVYFRKDDDPYVFELDQTVYDVFTAELIRNKLFDFIVDDVAGVRIERDRRTLELMRDGGVWKYAPDLFVELDQGRVNAMVSGIVAWTADEFVAYRDGDLEQEWIELPRASVTLALEDGTNVTLKIDRVRPGAAGQLGAWLEQHRIFRLPAGRAGALRADLDHYVAGESTESFPVGPDFGP